MTLRAFVDGASRGNPGESGIGILVLDETGNKVFSMHAYIGKTTNNVAEYTALLTLLRRVQKYRCTRLVVSSDSELMVRQVNGKYKVKDEKLRRYFQQVQAILEESPFEFELKHVSREENHEADRLANLGIETRKEMTI
ncbi:MAG: ribonuclease HI family protein [Ignavibacteriae bacterium]|nr:ribonuclease HI family protein [Ignavibacteriota bacterium]